MTEASGYLKALLLNLRTLREKAGLTASDLEERLILGPGWITRFEEGKTVPNIDMLFAIVHESGANINDLFDELTESPEAAEIERFIFAEQSGNNIVINFRYARFDAEYTLPNSTIDEFEEVIKTLRNGLSRIVIADDSISQAIKADSVAKTFLKATSVWPHVNPSDLWWFVIYRAYCDPFNHPAKFARLDLTQSWKRTGGWALEEIVVRHYGPFLKQHGINLFIANGETKRTLASQINVDERIESDKIDVFLTGDQDNKCPVFFGVVHVKSSIAERRTDDVPMSQALSRAGYTSIFWTMDCKSTPSKHPANRGELGKLGDSRSAKRKDIEDEGYFTGCFSYNLNTIPSLSSLADEQRIYVCDFTNPDDAFSRFILQRWSDFQAV
ncbi:helix-turn-helix domain-containing protein [Methylicorpusculum sp.]|uniref:helix-turn-helix domain-containing protein n=1 Tax=Methylicorpusculum sp. TaxID=2713644 RepID=UPI002AB8EEC7|nr:helix-turn-helix domain-containing protein [Methylicorpusculum sp.]MDZ4153994.1 BsaWI family type II restriction enzyme [Methylicorpusculum sp.]